MSELTLVSLVLLFSVTFIFECVFIFLLVNLGEKTKEPLFRRRSAGASEPVDAAVFNKARAKTMPAATPKAQPAPGGEASRANEE